MSKPNLLKTCSSCGLQKPLAAFLQLTESQGTVYGTICGDCRKAQMHKVKTPKEQDEFSTSSTGTKIDSKARVHDSIEKKEKQKKSGEVEKEREKTKSKKEKQRIQKIITVEKEEKEHRKTYLERGSFLSDTQNKVAHQRAFEEKIKIEQDSKLEAIKQDQEKTSINLGSGVAYQPSQTGAQIKYTQGHFLGFKKWLGFSAPITRSLESSAQTAEQKNIKIGAQLDTKSKDQKVEHPEETIEKDIEKTFRPSSGKS